MWKSNKILPTCQFYVKWFLWKKFLNFHTVLQHQFQRWFFWWNNYLPVDEIKNMVLHDCWTIWDNWTWRRGRRGWHYGSDHRGGWGRWDHFWGHWRGWSRGLRTIDLRSLWGCNRPSTGHATTKAKFITNTYNTEIEIIFQINCTFNINFKYFAFKSIF